MKKILFLSTLFFGLTFQAQITLKPGIYKSEGENQGIELKVNEDDTYQMIFLSGKLNSKKTILSTLKTSINKIQNL